MAETNCWIVSPMLRDTESFLQLRDEVAAACVADGRDVHIRHLVIDDSAGTDPDSSKLEGLDGVEVLTSPFNLGHQRAIVFGLRSLCARLDPDEIVVTMDSDGEDRPTDVPRLLAALDEQSAVLALAERTKRSEPLRFRIMYLFFRVWFRILTGTTVRSGNFAAQRADSLAATIFHPSFDLCYSSTLLELKRATVTVPCARGHRFAGASRMNTQSLMAHGVRMLLPLSERIAVRMMVVAAVSGAALFAASVLTVAGAFDDLANWTIAALIGLIALVFIVSFVTFVVLFASFAQASGSRRD